MGKEVINKMERMATKYFHQMERLEKGEEVKFTSYDELVRFTTYFFTSKYCKGLIYDKPKAKIEIWNREVETGISVVMDAFEKSIRLLCADCKVEYNQKKRKMLVKLGIEKPEARIIINSKEHSKIYEYPLEVMAEYQLYQKEVFPLKETYIVDLKKNSFSKI